MNVVSLAVKVAFTVTATIGAIWVVNWIKSPPPHDDSGHTWHHDDRTLFKYTKMGGQAMMAESGVTDFASGMPGFAGIMSDSQIEHVLAFIKSRWSIRSQNVQRERSHAAKMN